ncbi:ABC-type nickel/cobalt efflux system permease component RcnA [Rhizobium petrolearium]|uniref:nickel/cobalt transporter n=1 Tax=Neorhizobium petrolearium TaxID=515361 RepID=UPI001AE5EA2E|nr:nickel/cobalt transporter [Neorhizobium petrolearium]MBP1846929.1 ABC-type nickel/cobalt efflux system permease component RcnA [Neorhizobium petrolearium]
MLKSRRTLPLIVMTVLAVAGAAHAQSPLGVGSAEPAFSIGGPLGPFFAWINAHQQAFYRALTGALKVMREDPWALSGLIGLSFAYGVFHAAGPGHGKAVISSYMIANEVQLKRGIVISLISALLQGAVAILLVGAAYFVLRGSGITMTAATQAMEIASFALVALFGAWLLVKKIRALRMRVVTLPMAASAGAGRSTTGLNFQAVEIDDHEYQGDGEYCETCGASHMPDPAMLKSKDFSLREAWSAIIAVGLRPCSGAILVMSFALLNSLYLGGVLSVLAMSIGTAITVTILAILAVSAKDVAVRIAGPGSPAGRRVTHAIEIGGALFVLLVGLSLLGASLQASSLAGG